MSNHTARERILARLHASGTEQTDVPDAPLPPPLSLDRDARIERLAELMAAIRTEVHIVDAETWVDKLKDLAREKRWKRLLYGPEAPIGPAIESAWPSDADHLPGLVGYTESVEAFKDDLFQIDAGITSTRGGVADIGAVVLWPTPQEPRLISLVPSVHVAVLDADTVYNSLAEMMAAENWAAGMPTNALLISGPSKTADIEFTLVFGVHGPKELILLIRK
ncbi:MAG: lactate utilization protein [Desulfobacteraceae bacterium]|jgi:L-lactate dehydrogenase complex protein LldG|nr:lactate utilization protein [Desulfobacteraceae bacterium]